MRGRLAVIVLLVAACADRAPADDPGGGVDTDPDAPAETDPVDTDDTDTAAVDADDDGAPAGTDCDDADPGRHPGADETCDGVDQDCDGTIDDVAVPPGWWLDRDGDGYGDPAAAFASCTRPPAFVPAGGDVDCDDLHATVFPGAEEVPGDGLDGDCDGVEACYDDRDVDGHGAGPPRPGATMDCSGFWESAVDDDCDDDDFFVSPVAKERCGTVDRDCDGLVGDRDPSAVDPATFFADDDGDGFGDPLDTVEACLPPAGHVADATDCDDDLLAVHPGAPELCDLRDDDCDGRADDDDDDVQDPVTWHRDRDRDRYGSPTETRASCLPGGEFDVLDDRDCDDGLALRNPGATELPGNTLDEDCDGTIGCFVDADGDGLAGPTTGAVAGPSCLVPGFSNTIADCDDADADVTRRFFHADLDRDGFGSPTQVIGACEPPLFYVDDGTDCRDGDAAVHPGAVERVGDGVDQDCDGGELCPADGDGDRHGGPDAVASPDLRCDGAGEATAADDCDDADPDVHPGAVERIGDGLDADCDGDELCFRDDDRDGHGVPELVALPDLGCATPGVAPVPDDCDDAAATVYPGAGERCAAPDDDCDGLVDDADPDLAGAPVWFRDADGDGLGAGAPLAACLAPAGAVAVAGDCADDLVGWGPICPWAEVAAGDGATCARRTDGEVACAGLAGAAPDGVDALDVHGRLACGLVDGAATCWGDAPDDDPRRDVPPGAFVAIDVGDAAACALDATGALACWGAPAEPPEGAFVDVAVGAGTACAIDATGEVVCWGDAVCSVELASAAAITADDGVACRLDAVGRLACDGCADDRADAPAEPLLRFRDVAVGPAGACAVTTSGDLTCWGAAPSIATPPATPALAVTVGARHACALAEDRTLACWGEDAGALTP